MLHLCAANNPSYPTCMDRPAGQALQRRVWAETRRILTAAVPEAATVYEGLGL